MFPGRSSSILVAVCVLWNSGSALAAEGRGQGAIVNRDKVPVYTSASATEPVVFLNRGKSVAAISGNILLAPNYRFDEAEGRVRINYFATADDRGRYELGWIDPRALSKFTYDCECGPKSKCTPFDVRGLKFSFAWNSCFQEARDAKLEQLEQGWTSGNTGNRDGAFVTSIPRESSATAVSGGAAVPTRQPAPTAAGTSCGSSFTSAGSMLRGATFRASLDVGGVTRESAVKQILKALPEESLAVVAQDQGTGLIQTIGRTPNGKPYSVDFTITETGNGVTAAVVMKTGIGMATRDDAVRDQLCKILDSISDSAESATGAAAAARAKPAPVEDRLRRLEELRKKGLITEEEYKKKRAELLREL
jgi:hypothetical protein